MTEELGVLLLELENSWFKYIFLLKPTTNGKFTIFETDDEEEVIVDAYKCTRKEAEQFPQFRWIPLTDL